MLNNLRFFIKKSVDPYGLLGDKHFTDMLMQLISPKHFNRPNITEITSMNFVRKWMERQNKM